MTRVTVGSQNFKTSDVKFMTIQSDGSIAISGNFKYGSLVARDPSENDFKNLEEVGFVRLGDKFIDPSEIKGFRVQNDGSVVVKGDFKYGVIVAKDVTPDQITALENNRQPIRERRFDNSQGHDSSFITLGDQTVNSSQVSFMNIHDDGSVYVGGNFKFGAVIAKNVSPSDLESLNNTSFVRLGNMVFDPSDVKQVRFGDDGTATISSDKFKHGIIRAEGITPEQKTAFENYKKPAFKAAAPKKPIVQNEKKPEQGDFDTGLTARERAFVQQERELQNSGLVKKEQAAPTIKQEKPKTDQPVLEEKPAEEVVELSDSQPEASTQEGYVLEQQQPGSYTFQQEVHDCQALAQIVAGKHGLDIDLGKTGPNADGLDGFFGPKTCECVKTMQEHFGMEVTGKITPELMEKLEGAAVDITMVVSSEAESTAPEIAQKDVEVCPVQVASMAIEKAEPVNLTDTFNLVEMQTCMVTGTSGSGGQVFAEAMQELDCADEVSMCFYSPETDTITPVRMAADFTQNPTFTKTTPQINPELQIDNSNTMSMEVMG